jgi:hypothetical protein
VATISVHYDEECDCLVGSFAGTMNKETLKEYSIEVAKTASKHDFSYFLSDLREADVDFSSIEIINIPGIFHAAGLDISLRRAIVLSTRLNNYSLFETVANTRGFNVKVFTDLKKAMNWLKNKS